MRPKLKARRVEELGGATPKGNRSRYRSHHVSVTSKQLDGQVCQSRRDGFGWSMGASLQGRQLERLQRESTTNRLSAVGRGIGGEGGGAWELSPSPKTNKNQCPSRVISDFASFPRISVVVMEASVTVSNIGGPACKAVFGIAPFAGRGPVSSHLCSLRRIHIPRRCAVVFFRAT
jgi:hypothetical protein